MANSTDISWCDKTWNPFWGCSEIAPECGQHAPTGGHGLCYAAVFASRGLHPTHAGTAVAGKWTGAITRSGAAVWAAPLTWPAGSLLAANEKEFLAGGRAFTPLFTPFSVDYVCNEFTVRTDRAARLLGYRPIYSEEQAYAWTVEAVRRRVAGRAAGGGPRVRRAR